MTTETEKEKPSTSMGMDTVTVTTTAAVAVTTLAVWILGIYGIDMPPETQGALTGLIVFGAGCIVPSKRGKRSL